MVKDFIDTNDFSAKELLDMIQLSLSIKDAIRGGYYPAADEKQEPGHDLSAVLHPDPGVL